jgi:RNA 2',3'-cyclic 3'-phosphodiesterase
MHRLFIALSPPKSVRESLHAVMGGVEGARWQEDAQLHLTLRYIGEVERPLAEDIALALSRIRAEPVTLALDGIGTFDRKGVVHTIWAGVAPRSAAETLNRKVNQALAHLPLEPEDHGYLPHITIARGKPEYGLAEWCGAHAALSCDAFTLDAFGLYESHLTAKGSHYHLITRYPLRS